MVMDAVFHGPENQRLPRSTMVQQYGVYPIRTFHQGLEGESGLSPTPRYDALPPESRAAIEQIMEIAIVNLRESLAGILFPPLGYTPVSDRFEIASSTDPASGLVNRLFCLLAWEHVALILQGTADGCQKSLEYIAEQAQKAQEMAAIRI
jgi:hypothetical protein